VSQGDSCNLKEHAHAGWNFAVGLGSYLSLFYNGQYGLPPTVKGYVTLATASGLAALAAIVSPKAADLLRANASRMVPAKLEAAFKVEPAPAGVTQSLAQLKLDGTMGGVEVNLAAQGLGNVGAVEQADLRPSAERKEG
jgi:hypothetical protein